VPKPHPFSETSFATIKSPPDFSSFFLAFSMSAFLSSAYSALNPTRNMFLLLVLILSRILVVGFKVIVMVLLSVDIFPVIASGAKSAY